MGYVNGAFLVFAAAGIFALGIAFFWPTMLGFVSENIPQSGALGLAIMGGIGFLGGAIAQPVLGAIFDAQTCCSVPAGQVIEVLKSAAEGTQEAASLGCGTTSGGAHTLRYVAIVPALLIVFFSAFRKTSINHIGRIESLWNSKTSGRLNRIASPAFVKKKLGSQ